MGIRFGFPLALLAGAALSTPQGLSADGKFTWLNQCSPGLFQVCASVSIETLYDLNLNETTFALGISNLQGTPGLPDPGMYGIGGLGFSGFSVSSLPPDVGELYMAVGDGFPEDPNTSSGGSYADVFGGVDSDGIGSLWANYHGLGGGPESLIYGCDLPGFWANGWTCGGWLVGTGALPGRWELTNDLRASFHAYYTEPDWSTGCTTATIGGVRGSRDPCVTVPEPGPLLLLLTGITGLGIGGMLRRRKRELADDGS